MVIWHWLQEKVCILLPLAAKLKDGESQVKNFKIQMEIHQPVGIIVGPVIFSCDLLFKISTMSS